MTVTDAGSSIAERKFRLDGFNERRAVIAAAVREQAAAQPRRRRFEALTAAAKTLDLHDPREVARVRRAQGTAGLGWQAEAWTYYDALSEIKFGARFKGRALGKLRLFPAYQVDDSTDPVPLDTPTGDTGEPLVTDVNTLAVCDDAIRRLDSGRGGRSAMLERWGNNGFVVGEAYHVLYEDPLNTVTGETSATVSIDELRVNDRGEWCLCLEPTAQPSDWIVLPLDETMITRIWNMHPRYAMLADSSVRGVLDICEHLLQLQNESMGQSLSGMNNGITVFPWGMLDGNKLPPTDDGTGIGDGDSNPLLEKMSDYLTAGIANPRSAAVAVPFLLGAERDDIEAIRHITFDRTFDAVTDSRMEKLLERLGNGVDLPAQVINGTIMTDANHWSGWLIDDQTYRAHVQPDATEFVTALTVGYYRPYLLECGVPLEFVEKAWIWYDPADLVGDPDETDRAFQAVEAGLLGDAPARKRLGYSEAEAPTDKDIERRIVLKSHPKEQLPVSAVTSEGSSPGSSTEPAQPTAGDIAAQQAAPVTAAASQVSVLRRRLRAMPARWSNRDRKLTAVTLAECDSAMTRALDRAGAKLRTQAIRASSGTGAVDRRPLIDGVPNRMVAATLGRDTVTASLNISTDELLHGSFDEVVARFRSSVSRAQAATRNDLESLGMDEEQLDELEARQGEDLKRASAVLLASLLTLGQGRLFSPVATIAPMGEVDANLTVPAAMIREALSIAGGGTGPVTPGGATLSKVVTVTSHASSVPVHGAPGAPVMETVTEAMTSSERPSLGITDGPAMDDALSELGISTTGWVWNYGDEADRSRPFEPHAALDGVEFASWSDEQLANTDGWPDFDAYFPGDHDGCLCTAEQVLDGGSLFDRPSVAAED